tara:strand:- start:394 stop:666 length:273 start_codon:yes stop_codon:yes gene_type:complete
MDLLINIQECIFIEDLIDDQIIEVNNDLEILADTINSLDEVDFELGHDIQHIQTRFELKERREKLYNLKNKIYKHCQKVFATPEWQTTLT